MNSGRFKILKIRSVLLLQCVLFISMAVSTPQQISVKNYDCVQVAERWGDWSGGNAIVGNVITVNTKTGQSAIESNPTISPVGLFSPNGKYAVFWQMIQGTDDEAGLYIGSVADRHTQLLYKTTRKTR
jgi:hypothetical protein